MNIVSAVRTYSSCTKDLGASLKNVNASFIINPKRNISSFQVATTIEKQ